MTIIVVCQVLFSISKLRYRKHLWSGDSDNVLSKLFCMDVYTGVTWDFGLAFGVPWAKKSLKTTAVRDWTGQSTRSQVVSNEKRAFIYPKNKRQLTIITEGPRPLKDVKKTEHTTN